MRGRRGTIVVPGSPAVARLARASSIGSELEAAAAAAQPSSYFKPVTWGPAMAYTAAAANAAAGAGHSAAGAASSLSSGSEAATATFSAAEVEGMRVSDAEWCLGFVSTILQPPERWRRLPASRRKALLTLPAGRTLRTSALMWDCYAYGDTVVHQAALEWSSELADARKVMQIFDAERLLAAASGGAVGPSSSVADVGTTTSGPSSGPAGAVAGIGRGARASIVGMQAMAEGTGAGSSTSRASRASMVGTNATPMLRRRASSGFIGMEPLSLDGSPASGTASSLVPEAAYVAAKDAAQRYEALLAAPVPGTLFMDWLVTHPVARYILRQLHYPIGRVANYDGLNLDVPPADARHKLSKQAEGAAVSKQERTRLLTKCLTAMGIDIHTLRELRMEFMKVASVIASRSTGTGDGGDGSMIGRNGVLVFDQFRKLVSDFLARLCSQRKDAVVVYSMKKAMRNDPSSASTEPLGPPPPSPPAYAYMTEPARKKLVSRLFACFDMEGNGYVDVAEFAVGLARVMECAASDKLSLIFDVYDADSDGEVTLFELAAIINSAFKLSEAAAEERQTHTHHRFDGLDELEKREEDARFSQELAATLDINGDGTITRYVCVCGCVGRGADEGRTSATGCAFLADTHALPARNTPHPRAAPMRCYIVASLQGGVLPRPAARAHHVRVLRRVAGPPAGRHGRGRRHGLRDRLQDGPGVRLWHAADPARQVLDGPRA